MASEHIIFQRPITIFEPPKPHLPNPATFNPTIAPPPVEGREGGLGVEGRG